jgi:hypothetical protein
MVSLLAGAAFVGATAPGSLKEDSQFIVQQFLSYQDFMQIIR